jgi:hypothetical protein
LQHSVKGDQVFFEHQHKKYVFDLKSNIGDELGTLKKNGFEECGFLSAHDNSQLSGNYPVRSLLENDFIFRVDRNTHIQVINNI